MPNNVPFHKSFVFTTIIIPILVTIIGTMGYDAVKEFPILSTFLKWVSFVWNLSIKLLTYQISFYWIAITLLIVYIMQRIKTWVIKNANETPSFLSYTEDTFKGMKWSWTWIKDYSGKYDVGNLIPYCTACDVNMIYKVDYLHGLVGATCPQCSRKYEMNEMSKLSVQALIQTKLRKGRQELQNSNS